MSSSVLSSFDFSKQFKRSNVAFGVALNQEDSDTVDKMSAK